MKHKLVAVIGNTPQVMTETFWALFHGNSIVRISGISSCFDGSQISNLLQECVL